MTISANWFVGRAVKEGEEDKIQVIPCEFLELADAMAFAIAILEEVHDNTCFEPVEPKD